jgi:hypothetical protein
VTPHQWRAGSGLAVVVVICAGVLRFWSLDTGIPYAVGVDEPQIMGRAVSMMKTADFNPHFFDWPSLTIYLHLAVSCATFLLGSMRGLWTNLDQIGAADMFLASRAVTAAFGTATVWLTYLVGRRWGTLEAVLAALVMAVIPNHVRESHYVLADVPTAFLTTLTFLLALRAQERSTLLAFAWAGLAAGLAASSKYNGSIAFLFPLLAAGMTAGTPALRLQRGLVALAAAGAGFLVGTPFAVLDMPKFLNDYARLAALFARERGGEPGWSIYLKHLRGALGWPALVMTFAGLLIAVTRIVRDSNRVRWVLLVTFAAVYFLVMAGSYQIYGRYLLPLFPMAAILLAVATAPAVRLLRRAPLPNRATHLLALALVGGLIAVPARSSIGFNRNLGRVSTVDLAYQWIVAHVPPGSKIVLERQVLILPAPRYASVNVTSLLEESYDDYASAGFEYMLSSAFEEAFAAPQNHREAYLGYRTLFARAERVATFYRSHNVDGPQLELYLIRK